MKARSAKAKGRKLEKWVHAQLKDICESRVQPGSGIYMDFPHDNRIKLPQIGELIIECKSWKSGWRTGDKAMGLADLLVIKPDREEPRIYMTWGLFKELVQAVSMSRAEIEKAEQ